MPLALEFPIDPVDLLSMMPFELEDEMKQKGYEDEEITTETESDQDQQSEKDEASADEG
jgi:hypothetical protein